MVQRTEPRIPKDASVRVFGMDSRGRPVSVQAQTVDVSQHGARVSGVNSWETAGEIIGVRYGTEKARYRIVWVGSPGTSLANQIGLQCVETGKYIWGAASPAATDINQKTSPAPIPARSIGPQFGRLRIPPQPSAEGRRKDQRFTVSGGANVREVGKNVPQWTIIQDLSLGGCYLETTAPLPAFTRVDVSIQVGAVKIEARGTVTVKHPLVGMGIQFSEMTPLNRERLRQLISDFERSSTASHGL